LSWSRAIFGVRSWPAGKALRAYRRARLSALAGGAFGCGVGFNAASSPASAERSGSSRAAPALSSTTRDAASYLAVEGGESETLALPAALDVEIYVGSLDSYNTITFGGPGGASYTYTGSLLATLTTAIDNGDQQSGSSNGLFDFSFAAPVTSVTFSSGQNALEVAGVSVSSTVPEPSTWAMMLLGFAGLRRGRAKRNSPASAD
jgi:hypothetical protein